LAAARLELEEVMHAPNVARFVQRTTIKHCMISGSARIVPFHQDDGSQNETVSGSNIWKGEGGFNRLQDLQNVSIAAAYLNIKVLREDEKTSGYLFRIYRGENVL
jgi:hypothetical protein